ncbi:hypothetical protein NQ317_001806 [Molorchus minor]|uniref:Polycystin domain-containing protein n=1 Tax=Molorchus minor TaxID=1323400 RepID=A0ABQ9JU55_9CUCU|nr:hypothetical protein NQ317_001806 [Molorchus minor]
MQFNLGLGTQPQTAQTTLIGVNTRIIEWTYNDVSVTKSLPYWGKVSTYGAGGYYIDFTRDKSEIQEIVKKIKGQSLDNTRY